MVKPSTLLALLGASIVISTSIIASERSEFEQWMQRESSSFQEYRDKRDKEFTGFLQSQWKEMQTFQGLVRDKTPKPVNIPKAPQVKPEPKPHKPTRPAPPPISKVPHTPDISPKPKPPELKPKPPVVVKVPDIKPAPVPKKVPPVAPVVKRPSGKAIDIQFFGHRIRFYVDPKLAAVVSRPVNEKAMSRVWSEMSKADYEGLIKQINAQRKPLNLNDWSYALLNHNIAQKMHPRSKNNQAIFTWFMMIKAGYKARIAYDQNYIYLLMPSKQQLFAAPYFKFDKLRYYALSFDGVKQKPGRIFTYDGHYPGANRLLDMSLSRAFNTARSAKSRSLSFSYNNQSYRVKVDYDGQTIRFLNTYPQMDIGMYFNSQVNAHTANPILRQLKPMVEGKSEKDAVNLLLRFVQTAFKYKTDEQQFGIENYLFPEETLHYPYSDCEDRSVFFAWLVHELLGLRVVGLDFPGHIAAAVKFTERVEGDAIQYQGQRYVVTDPTYINARAGMTMPEFKNRKPGVIRILN